MISFCLVEPFIKSTAICFAKDLRLRADEGNYFRKIEMIMIITNRWLNLVAPITWQLASRQAGRRAGRQANGRSESSIKSERLMQLKSNVHVFK